MNAPFRLFLGILLLAAGGCSGDAPPGEPVPASFADYYAGEIFLVEKTRIEDGDSTLLSMRLDSLRRHHNLSARDRDSLLSYCQASLPRWESFLKEVLTRIESRDKGVEGANGAKRSGDASGPAGDGRGTGKPNAVRP